MQVYSDSSRESETFTLPNVEVFHVSQLEASYNVVNLDHGDEYTITAAGWYWWSCFPGCLPDGSPFGPFATEAEAIADAQEQEIV